MLASDCLKELSNALISNGAEDAHKESEIILADCLGIDRVSLYRDNPALSAWQTDQIREIIRRRLRKEPIHYVIGHVDFCGLKIKVGPGVLIPRPETELIVEEAIKAVKRYTLHVTSEGTNSSRVTHYASRILDLCTGSACIALAIAKNIPDSEVYATDISGKALKYAKENAKINNIKNVIFRKGDLFEPVRDLKFDIIVSNPPYIRKTDINNLQPEIRRWEPIEALDGGEDGLHFYRKIFPLCRKYLKSNGCIVLETGDGGSTDVVKIAGHSGLRCLSVIRDYSGIERILSLTLR